MDTITQSALSYMFHFLGGTRLFMLQYGTSKVQKLDSFAFPDFGVSSVQIVFPGQRSDAGCKPPTATSAFSPPISVHKWISIANGSRYHDTEVDRDRFAKGKSTWRCSGPARFSWVVYLFKSMGSL